MGKKERELESLRIVLPEQEGLTILESETPDFVVEVKGSRFRYGVEVTELFASGSQARLKRRKNYRDDLLSGKGVCHKDDTGSISVRTVTLKSAEGDRTATAPAIRLEMPSTKDYFGTLCQSILSKHRKHQSIIGTRLPHVNLIIHDQSGFLTGLRSEHLIQFLLQEDLSKILLEHCCFREVYLVGKVDGRSGYARLKMLLLVSELFAFAEWVKELGNPGTDPGLGHPMDLFACYLQQRTIEPVFRLSTETGEYVVFGDSSCGVDAGEVKIVMYHDSQFPDTIHKPTPSHPLLQKLTEDLVVDKQVPCIDLWQDSPIQKQASAG